MSSEKETTAFDEKTSQSAHESTAPGALDETLQKRVWRKLDWHLLPFVSLLYLLSFLCVKPDSYMHSN
jgi:hypothetical protein